MTWRYVFAKHSSPDGLGGTEEWWAVHEVYRDADGGRVGWTKEPVRPQGSTWQELADDLGRMTDAMAANEVLDLTSDPPGLVPRLRPRRPHHRSKVHGN